MYMYATDLHKHKQMNYGRVGGRFCVQDWGRFYACSGSAATDSARATARAAATSGPGVSAANTGSAACLENLRRKAEVVYTTVWGWRNGNTDSQQAGCSSLKLWRWKIHATEGSHSVSAYTMMEHLKTWEQTKNILSVTEMAVTTEAGGSGDGGPTNVTINKGLSSVTNKLEPPLETACKVGVLYEPARRNFFVHHSHEMYFHCIYLSNMHKKSKCR
jgi:hypothetical protein